MPAGSSLLSRVAVISSRRTPSVSRSPRSQRGWRIGPVISSFSPTRSTTSDTARFPLSTLETYRGVSGVSVRVSYQLEEVAMR